MNNKIYKHSEFWIAMMDLVLVVLFAIQGTVLSGIASFIWLINFGLWLYKANKAANEKQQKGTSTN